MSVFPRIVSLRFPRRQLWRDTPSRLWQLQYTKDHCGAALSLSAFLSDSLPSPAVSTSLDLSSLYHGISLFIFSCFYPVATSLSRHLSLSLSLLHSVAPSLYQIFLSLSFTPSLYLSLPFTILISIIIIASLFYLSISLSLLLHFPPTLSRSLNHSISIYCWWCKSIGIQITQSWNQKLTGTCNINILNRILTSNIFESYWIFSYFSSLLFPPPSLTPTSWLS